MISFQKAAAIIIPRSFGVDAKISTACEGSIARAIHDYHGVRRNSRDPSKVPINYSKNNCLKTDVTLSYLRAIKDGWTTEREIQKKLNRELRVVTEVMAARVDIGLAEVRRLPSPPGTTRIVREWRITDKGRAFLRENGEAGE